MAGKMIYGDPKVTSKFTLGTGMDLAKDGKMVLVVCSIPESVRNEFPSIEFDLIDGTIRRLKRRGIQVVNPDDVASWIDDNGGYWEEPDELAEHFNADVIVHVDLSRFSYKEENSPSMYRGRAEGTLYGYEVRKVGDEKQVREVFVREFIPVYPANSPIPAEVPVRVFQKRFLDHVITQITQTLADHRISELIE